MPDAPEAISVAPDANALPLRPARTILGVTPPALAVLATLLLMVGWNAWTTRELLELRERRIVSVSLSTLVREFVGSEARRGSTREEATAKTQLYLAAVAAAMRKLSADGTTVLVSEAVVGNSVPDYTPVVARAVTRVMAAPPPVAALAPAASPGERSFGR